MAFEQLDSLVDGLLGAGQPQPPIPQRPIAQQPGGLGAVSQPSPSDVLEETQDRLVSKSPLDMLLKLASGEDLEKLKDTKDKANKEQVEHLLKQGEYSGLDAVMAGLRGMQLGRVPAGVSPLAYGFQGTGDATDKFTTLKDKYKQAALDIQAKEAQQAYTDSLTEIKQARQLVNTNTLADKRSLALQTLQDSKNRLAQKIAEDKASGKGFIT